MLDRREDDPTKSERRKFRAEGWLLAMLLGGVLAMVGLQVNETWEANATVSTVAGQTRTLLEEHHATTGILREVCALSADSGYSARFDFLLGDLIKERADPSIEKKLLVELATLASTPAHIPKSCN